MIDTSGIDIEQYIEKLNIQHLSQQINDVQIASSIAFNILQKTKSLIDINRELINDKFELLTENQKLKDELEKRKEFMKSSANLYIK